MNFVEVYRMQLEALRQRKEEPALRRRSSALMGILFFVLVLSGLFVRVGDQATKGFWVDEVWRAQQIVHAPSYASLEAGEYFGMEAPVQLSEYLLGKTGLALFGKQEIAFRVWPLAFSLLSVLLFTLLAAKTMGPLGATVSVLMFSLSPGLVEHAHEFKPYTLEVFVTILVLLWYFKEWSSNLARIISAIPLLGFIFIGTNLWPFLTPLFYRCLPVQAFLRIPKKFYLWILLPLGGATFFLWQFLSRYIENLRANKIFSFWDPYFPTNLEKARNVFDQNILGFLDWYVDGPGDFLPDGSGVGIFVTVLLFIVLPTCVFIKQREKTLGLVLILWIPVLASFFGVFPPFTRVATFMSVAVILLVGFFVDLLPLSRRLELGIAFLVVVSGLGLTAFEYADRSFPGSDRHLQPIDEVVTQLHQRSKPGDFVVANYPGKLSFYFYELPANVKLLEEVSFSNRNTTAEAAKKLVQKLGDDHPGSRIWLIASHRTDGRELYRQEIQSRDDADLLYEWESHQAYGFLMKVDK